MQGTVRIGREDLGALAAGLRLLGSGGGGEPEPYARILARALGARHLQVLSPADRPAATVVAVGIVGSTGVFLEKLPSGNELSQAVRAVSRWTDATPTAVMNIEAGGLNGLAGLVVATELGLPFVDADLLGRAMPRLDQFSWSVSGRPLTPCALYEPSGQTVVVDGARAEDLERTVRTLLAATGGWAALALRPIGMAEVVETSLVGSLRRAVSLGRAHARLPGTPTPALVEEALGGRVLADGRVGEVSRYAAASRFGRGSVTVRDRRSDSIVRVESENEYLLALVDGEVHAATPDLICVLDRRTATPLMVDGVRAGDEVLVVTLPGPGWWQEDERRLATVDLRAYGLETA